MIILNRVQSLGLDLLWRKRALACLARAVSSPRRILDLATGTADFALAAARLFPSAHVTGIDLTPAMLDIGRHKAETAGLTNRITFEEGDACALACADGTFDTYVIDSEGKTYWSSHLEHQYLHRNSLQYNVPL